MFFLRQVTEGTPSLEYNGFNSKCAKESGQQPGNKTGIIYTPLFQLSLTQ